jgi:NAD(P)-dependent dehydrogenase (short-subunit alcohol dehydrogenase family)
MGELIRNEASEPKASDASLKGKTVVLSGATSGIGLETARLFAGKGARLILLNRDPEKSAALEEELKRAYDCEVRTLRVDFGSLGQIRACAKELLALEHPIDVLIHNSGVYYTKKTQSRDNIEMVFQVNHLGSFMINYILKERMRAENRARIIYVNSEGHRFSLAGVHTDDLDWKRHIYTGLKSYGAAKTAQLLTMLKFSEYFSDCSVTINAMHPGNVATNIGENNGKLYRAMKRKLILPSAKEPSVSARALMYLASSSELAGVSGKFFNLTTQERPAPHARDRGAVEAVWEKSQSLCGLG